MKKVLLYISISLSTLLAQFDLYPVTDFFGGGIGYSPMYINIDKLPATDLLENIGLDPTKFDNPFVVHGGEGFAHMTGKWRIGGYAGTGSSSISSVIGDLKIWTDADTNGLVDAAELLAAEDYTGSNAPTIEAKLSISLGAGSVEYIMPVFQDLEISAGALMGLGRLNVSIDQYAANPSWEKLFSFAYGDTSIMIDGEETNITYLYEEDDGRTDPPLFAKKASGVMSDLSGTFFNFQPYVAVKWQLLDRVGLRISVGFNKGTIGQGRWKLNGRYLIGDSEEYTLQGVSFRTMLYLGL